MDATRGGLVTLFRNGFQSNGPGLTFDGLVSFLGNVWNGLLDRIEHMSGEIATRMVERVRREPRRRRASDRHGLLLPVGYIVGTVVFQVVLDIFTAGAYTFIGPTVMAIARFINFPAKLLGPMFELIGRFGRLMPGFIRNLATRLGGSAMPFMERIMRPLAKFGEDIGAGADELFGMWAERATQRGTEGVLERTGIVRSVGQRRTRNAARLAERETSSHRGALDVPREEPRRPEIEFLRYRMRQDYLEMAATSEDAVTRARLQRQAAEITFGENEEAPARARRSACTAPAARLARTRGRRARCSNAGAAPARASAGTRMPPARSTISATTSTISPTRRRASDGPQTGGGDFVRTTRERRRRPHDRRRHDGTRRRRCAQLDSLPRHVRQTSCAGRSSTTGSPASTAGSRISTRGPPARARSPAR